MVHHEKSTQTDNFIATSHQQHRVNFKSIIKFMSSLLLPLVLGIFTSVITIRQESMASKQREADRVSAELQRAQERQLSNDRYLNEVFDTYIKEIGDMLANNNGSLTINRVTASLVRIKTLNIFRRLDARRSTQVIRFLYEAKQLTKTDSEEALDLATAEIRSIDFRESAINGKELMDLSLTRVFLINVTLVDILIDRNNFTLSQFNGVNFFYSQLTNVYFSSAIIDNANFSKAYIGNAEFTAARIDNANFSNGYFQSVDFSSATISNAIFSHAKFRMVKFSSASLTDVDFSYSSFVDVTFSSSRFHNVSFLFAQLRGTSFVNTVIDNSNFSFAILGNSIHSFSFCTLTRIFLIVRA